MEVTGYNHLKIWLIFWEKLSGCSLDYSWIKNLTALSSVYLNFHAITNILNLLLILKTIWEIRKSERKLVYIIPGYNQKVVDWHANIIRSTKIVTFLSIYYLSAIATFIHSISLYPSLIYNAIYTPDYPKIVSVPSSSGFWTLGLKMEATMSCG